MRNGASSEHESSSRYVTAAELSLINQKIESNTINIAVLSSESKTMAKDMGEMKASLVNIDEKMGRLVNNKEILRLLTKGAMWMTGTFLVPSGTMIVAHFTGVIKIINRMLN